MQSYWFLFFDDLLLLTTGGTLPKSEEPPVGANRVIDVRPLPSSEEQSCKYGRLKSKGVPMGYQLMGLRAAYKLLPFEQYNMAGKARELLYWDASTHFCGVCGSPLHFHTAISKCCSNCGKEVWPALTIAIIVAITRGDELLLVQSKKFRHDYMGLVAGFVETAETLEDCVQREVYEETHLRIRNIRYFGSQSWPYPNGLMAGFTAEYESGEICIQQSELRKGGWYKAENLPAVPEKLSMARKLIDDWLERQGKGYLSNSLQAF